MDKRKLSFLLKNQFLRRKDISDCLDRYQFIAWIKDFKNEQFYKVRNSTLLKLFDQVIRRNFPVSFQASRVLENLASNENEYFMKQKVYLIE